MMGLVWALSMGLVTALGSEVEKAEVSVVAWEKAKACQTGAGSASG